MFQDCIKAECENQCPNGCNGCDNSICQCMVSSCPLLTNKLSLQYLTAVFQDVSENANWNKCMDVNGMSLARCIYSCQDNGDCENVCVEQFKTQTDNCPCEVCAVLSFSMTHTV